MYMHVVGSPKGRHRRHLPEPSAALVKRTEKMQLALLADRPLTSYQDGFNIPNCRPLSHSDVPDHTSENEMPAPDREGQATWLITLLPWNSSDINHYSYINHITHHLLTT